MFIKIIGKVNGNPNGVIAQLRTALAKEFPHVEISCIDVEVYGDYDIIAEVSGVSINSSKEQTAVASAISKSALSHKKGSVKLNFTESISPFNI